MRTQDYFIRPRRYVRLYRFMYVCTGYTQKNGAVSKVNKKFISHLIRVQRTPSAAANVQVSHALPGVSSFVLTAGPWGQFPRWRRSRKRLSVCSVLRCPDLWLQCSVSFVHGLEKTHHAETGMRSELLLAHEKLGQLPLLTVYVVPV